MQGALVVSFTTPVPGREKEVLNFAREMDAFWGKQASQGRNSQPEYFWASRGHSFWLVKGEIEQLVPIIASPEVQRLFSKGSLLIQDFEYDLHYCGREEGLKPYEEAMKDLKIA